jgi:hypothetical protein
MMRIFEDDNDVGIIVFAALATALVIGSVAYLYNSPATFQTADLPITMEKTVPTIAPIQLQ